MEKKADFAVSQPRGSAIVSVEPLSDEAREWLDDNVSSESIWLAGALIVDLRFVEDLIAGMLAAGLRQQHDE